MSIVGSEDAVREYYLRARIRELEQRVRELEERLKQVQAIEVANVELCQRIAKAREILTTRIPQSQLALEIIRAVEALEGK